jgi:hypothetical protein
MYTPLAGHVNWNHTSSSLLLLQDGFGEERVAPAVVKNCGAIHLAPGELIDSCVAFMASFAGSCGVISITAKENVIKVKLFCDQKRK